MSASKHTLYITDETVQILQKLGEKILKEETDQTPRVDSVWDHRRKALSLSATLRKLVKEAEDADHAES